MNYELNKKQLDTLIKPYFDMRFKDSVIRKGLVDGINEWFGFWIDDEHILGYPGNHDETWYCSGPHFYDGILLYSMESKDYYEAMRRYVKKNYPELKIKKIY